MIDVDSDSDMSPCMIAMILLRVLLRDHPGHRFTISRAKLLAMLGAEGDAGLLLGADDDDLTAELMPRDAVPPEAIRVTPTRSTRRYDA